MNKIKAVSDLNNYDCKYAQTVLKGSTCNLQIAITCTL